MLAMSYGDILEYVGRKIGLVSSSVRLRQLVYDAVEELMEESDGTLFRRQACLYAHNGAVALPQDVLAVEYAAYNGERVGIIRRSMEFVEGIEGAQWHSWQRVTLHDRGFGPIWYDPPDDVSKLVAITTDNRDTTKTIQLTQVDKYGNTAQVAVPITLQGSPLNPVSVMDSFVEIRGVGLPQERAGTITLGCLNSVNQMWLLAVYDKHMRAAQFRRYGVMGLPNDNNYYLIYAQVRIGFVEPASDDEPCPVLSRQAVWLMVTAQLLAERGLPDQAEAARVRALARLRAAMLAARGGGVGVRLTSPWGIKARDYNL